MESTRIDTTEAAPALARFTVEPKPFAEAVAFLARRVIDPQSRVAIASCVRIVADLERGAVIVAGFGYDVAAAVTVPAVIETPGEFCTDAAALSSALDKARKDKECGALEIGDSGERMELRARRARFNLGRFPAAGFPMPIGGIEMALPAFTMPGTFAADLAALAPCQSVKEQPYYLRGVALSVRDMAGRDRLTLAATDGHSMGIASRAVPAGAEVMPDCILSAKLVDVIVRAAKLAAPTGGIGAHIEEFARFTVGPVAIWGKLVDATYPDWTKPFGDQLTPTGEAAPLFPELLPAYPVGAMNKLAKAAPGAIAWEPAAQGVIGAVAGDDGLLFACMARPDASVEPVKGYRVEYSHGAQEAGVYLCALAEARHGSIPADWGKSLICEGGAYRGLTIGKRDYMPGRWEEKPNWDTLQPERFYIEGGEVWSDGAYSAVMPAERATREPDHSVTIEGDGTYPLAVNSGGAIHLTKDQVRAIVGESVFETMAVTLPDGKSAFVLRWCWEQGDSRFLTVRGDGRTFAGGVYVTRAEIEAGPVAESLAGDVAEICQPEPAQGPSEPVAGISGPSLASNALAGPEISLASEADFKSDALSALVARIEALELAVAVVHSTPSAEPAEQSAAPIAEPAVRPKRAPAHERAIRRAWAERKARREASVRLRIGQAQYDGLKADLATAEAREEAARGEVVQIKAATDSRVRHLSAQLEATRTNMEKWADEARAGRRAKHRRKAAAERARRMIVAERGRHSMARAELFKLKRDLADPTQPERASDIARLIVERDTARTALAATEARTARMQGEINHLAEAYEAMVSRVSRAEAAVRRMLAA